jgi:WXG100 family type VII secretion target
MSSNIKITDQELDALSKRITNVNDSIHTEIRNLERVIDMVSPGWRGQASNAYKLLQAQVNDDVTKLNRVLLQIKEAVDTTRKDFATEEAENAAVLNSMQSKIGGL